MMRIALPGGSCARNDTPPLAGFARFRIEALLHRRGVSDGRDGCDAPDRWTEDAPDVGRADAAQFPTSAKASAGKWLRRLGLPALCGPVEVGGVDSGWRGDSAHPASRAAAGRRAGDAALARPAPAVRSVRRSRIGRRLLKIGPLFGDQGRRCVERRREAMTRPGRRWV